MPRNGWLDVHAHFYPPESEARRRERWEQMQGSGWLVGPEPPRWDPVSTLGYMDRTGIAMQMLSNIPKKLDELRASNSYGAEMVRTYPDRFGFLAALPTNDPDAALEELARAENELNADGFAVTCRYNDVYLSDARLQRVWAELDRRGAVVFAHPDAYAPAEMGRPCVVIDVAFETARTFTDMLYKGVFRRYPNIRFVVAHCGGALPALSGRLLTLGLESWVPNPEQLTPAEMRVHLRRLYLDTAATMPTALLAALAMTSLDRIVYGSDCGVPCTTDATMDANILALESATGLTREEVEGIGRRARELFPKAAARVKASLAAGRDAEVLAARGA